MGDLFPKGRLTNELRLIRRDSGGGYKCLLNGDFWRIIKYGVTQCQAEWDKKELFVRKVSERKICYSLGFSLVSPESDCCEPLFTILAMKYHFALE